MTGKKYGFQQAIPPAAEWFDFDRSEKTMAFDPENTEPPEADVTKDVPHLRCPHCGTDKLKYIGEAWDAGYFLSGHWRCQVCLYQFLDNDADYKP